MTKVAILIPTKNRSEFLIRQLRYYASVKSPHPVYIGDASNGTHKEVTERAVKKLQSEIPISYNYWPELDDRQAFKKLGEAATEKYCAYTGDDDFLIPNSLIRCAEFLKNNPKYRSAQGKGVLFTLEESLPYGVFNGLGTYWQKMEAFEESGEKRLLNFCKNYWVPDFSVNRTNEFCEDMQGNTTPCRHIGELVRTCTVICRGKSKFLDCLYLIRQGNVAKNYSPDVFDWLTHPDWQPSYQTFRSVLVSTLTEVDGISNERASAIVKKAFWSYLAISMNLKYNLKYTKASIKTTLKANIKTSLREYARTVPWLKNMVNIMQSAKGVIRAGNGELSLPALLHHTSPYHKDFLPVYDIISEKDKSFGHVL